MARLSHHHQNLNEQGEGKCSVPMWQGGCPSGFCDETAFGAQTKEYLDAFKYRDPRYWQPAFAMGLACPAHGGPKARATEAEAA